MNFNVYVKKNVGERITRVAKDLHRSRNSIISEALEEWLDGHETCVWPKHFFDFEPIENVPDFKSFRDELANNLTEDPLN